jgi:hypothetical protein
MFFRVQDILSQHTTTWSQRKSRMNDFLCSGLLYCSCGAKMYHKKDARKGKPSYYQCSSRWNGKTPCGAPCFDASQVDRDTTWGVMMYLTDPRFIEKQLKEAANGNGHEKKQADLTRLQGSLAGLQRKLENAISFSLDHPEYIGQVKKLKTEIADTKAKAATLESELASHVDAKDVAKLAKAIKAKFDSFDTWPMGERKAALASHVDRITLSPSGNVGFNVKVSIYPADVSHGIGWEEKANKNPFSASRQNLSPSDMDSSRQSA